MYIPRGGGERRQQTLHTTRTKEVNPVEHGACCLAGLAATGLMALLVYPVLVAVTQPLQVLSSTAIVFVLVFLWLLSWLGIEIIWEWRAGRISFPD